MDGHTEDGERPMWTICRPVCSTLSHRDKSSPRLEASPLLFAVPLSTPTSICFIPLIPHHRAPRPLTYHHNRYIIPRSVFYSRVTPWNAFVRDIVCLSLFLSTLPALPSSSLPSSTLFSRFAAYLISEITLFFFFVVVHFFDIRLYCTNHHREKLNCTLSAQNNHIIISI